MSVKSVFVALVLCASLAACAIGNTVDYRDVAPPLGVSSTKSVAVEVVEKRAYVLAGDNTPQWVGMQRGGFGNPFGVHTTSGAPLSDDLTQAITDSLKASGVKAAPAKANQARDRLLLVSVKDWKSDAMMNTRIFFDVEAEVRDAGGTVLARNAVQEMRADEGGGMELPSTKLARAKEVFRQMLDKVLNASIRDALR